jgi:hypothetical protein
MGRIVISKYFLVGLLYFILIAHAIAIWQSWYFKTSWFDIPMHFLGGAWLAILFLIYFKKYFAFDSCRKLAAFFVLSAFVLFIGIGWEGFEFLNEQLTIKSGRMPSARLTVGDTLADLFFDFLGGLAIFVLYFRSKKSSA